MRFIDKLKEHATYTDKNLIAVCTESDEVNYEQLLHKVTDAMAYFSSVGLNANSVVGVTLSNELDHLIVTLALFGLGTKQLILPTFDSIALRKDFAERVNMTDLICDDNSSFLNMTAIEYPPKDFTNTHQTINGNSIEGELFIKTSGTTGRPNIVLFTETQLALQAERVTDYKSERLLRLASMEHNNSKRHRLYSIWNGGTNIFKPSDSFDAIDYILKKNVTCLDIARIHLANLVKHSQSDKLSTIKVRAGGSAIPYALRFDIEKNVTQKLYLRYGATECGTIAMTNPGEYDKDVSSGKCVEGVELEIVDKNDNPLPKGSTGYVRLKVAGMAYEYFDNSEQTGKRFKYGWFYPGDLGYFREDEHLVLQGRADDMIIMNGLNIYSAEIEKVLESHPSIKTAVALPLESSIHGQIPVAAVELNTAEQIESYDLLKYCREILGIRTPRKIFILSDLPRSPQGKIIKVDLKKMLNQRITDHE
jgi:long-chain acyl-CoA synthetase